MISLPASVFDNCHICFRYLVFTNVSCHDAFDILRVLPLFFFLLLLFFDATALLPILIGWRLMPSSHRLCALPPPFPFSFPFSAQARFDRYAFFFHFFSLLVLVRRPPTSFDLHSFVLPSLAGSLPPCPGRYPIPPSQKSSFLSEMPYCGSFTFAREILLPYITNLKLHE